MYTVHKDEYEDFLNKKGYNINDVVGEPEKETEIPFNEKVSGDGGVGDILKPNISPIGTVSGFNYKKEDLPNIHKKIGKIAEDYSNSYKGTAFEFEQGDTSFLGKGTGNANKIRVKGENGVSKIFNFEDGNQIPEINKFILENQDLKQRQKQKDFISNISSIGQSLDDINWIDTTEKSFNKANSGLFDAEWDSDLRAFTPPRYQNKNYNSFEEFINGKDGYENKEDLRKYFREQYNQRFQTYEQRLGQQQRDMGDVFPETFDTLDSEGISEYHFDIAFEDLINKRRAEEKVEKFYEKKNDLQNELQKLYPGLYKDVNLDDYDYRDMPQYDDLSKLYFNQIVSNELSGDEYQLGIRNSERNDLTKKLSELRQNGQAGSEEALQLVKVLNGLEKEIEELNDTVFGVGTDMYYSHVNGRIVKPKNEQEASILKKDMTYQSVLDLYKTYDNEFYNIKNDGDFQDLEEKFNFNSLEKNSLLDLGNT